jgi:hypothetical protein
MCSAVYIAVWAAHTAAHTAVYTVAPAAAHIADTAAHSTNQRKLNIKQKQQETDTAEAAIDIGDEAAPKEQHT